MCESMCEACYYYYQGTADDFPTCHYSEDEGGFLPPCEDDEPGDIDDDCGFDPYEGCYTYDC